MRSLHRRSKFRIVELANVFRVFYLVGGKLFRLENAEVAMGLAAQYVPPKACCEEVATGADWPCANLDKAAFAADSLQPRARKAVTNSGSRPVGRGPRKRPPQTQLLRLQRGCRAYFGKGHSPRLNGSTVTSWA